MLLFPELAYLLTIRALRLLRIFGFFQTGTLYRRDRSSSPPCARTGKNHGIPDGGCVLVVMMGNTLYVVEGPVMAFTSIPKSMYWALSLSPR